MYVLSSILSRVVCVKNRLLRSDSLHIQYTLTTISATGIRQAAEMLWLENLLVDVATRGFILYYTKPEESSS